MENSGNLAAIYSWVAFPLCMVLKLHLSKLSSGGWLLSCRAVGCSLSLGFAGFCIVNVSIYTIMLSYCPLLIGSKLLILSIWANFSLVFPDTASDPHRSRWEYSPGSLAMSSWPGTITPHWQTSSSSRVRVSKVSAFRFVSWTVCSPYPTFNLRRLSIPSRRCTDLEQSSTAYHICSVTSRLLLSLEDILLRTLLPMITFVMPTKWHCHLWTR